MSMNLSNVNYEDFILSDTSRRPLPNGMYPCLMCAKPFWLGFFIGEPDQVCWECTQAYAETARVVCAVCRVTIGRIIPGIQPESGYVVRKHAILHSNACNICQPGLTESYIVEIRNWIKNVRRGKIFISPSGPLR